MQWWRHGCNSYQPRFEKIRGSWTSIRLSTPFVSHGSKTIHRTRHHTMAWTRGQLWKCTCGKFRHFQNLSCVQEKILETVREFLDLVKECKILKILKFREKVAKLCPTRDFSILRKIVKVRVSTWRKTRENRQISRVRNRVKTAVLTLFRNPRKSGKNGDFALILHVLPDRQKVAKKGEKCKNPLRLTNPSFVWAKCEKNVAF